MAIRITVFLVMMVIGLGLGIRSGSFGGPPHGVHLSDDGAEITVSGRFEPGLEKRFREVLDRSSHARRVRLYSGGGYVTVAGAIRNDIAERRIDTFVDSQCASACTIAFLAGQRRVVTQNARLGFHRFSRQGRDTGVGEPMLLRYYWVAGIAQNFIDRVAITPPDEVWYPTIAEMRAAGVITEVLPKKGWW